MLIASIVVVYFSMTKSNSDVLKVHQMANRFWYQVAMLDSSDLAAVQALLVLSIYEWRVGNGYKAWMIVGVAIRIMQSLLLADPSKPKSPAKLQSYNRTLWSCFVMDWLYFSGIPQPVTLSCDSLHTFWLSSEVDFLFGHSPSKPILVESE